MPRYDKEKYSILYKWGELNRLKKSASYATGDVLDVGWFQKPNMFLNGATGIDIVKGVCPENYREVRVVRHNGTFPIPDNQFDTVILGEVIEHVPNVDRFMKEVKRVMKKGGKLIISTPIPSSPVEIIIQTYQWLRGKKEGAGKGDHCHEFLVSNMLTLLNMYGFEVIKYHGLYFQIPFTNIQIPAPLPLSYQTLYVAVKK